MLPRRRLAGVTAAFGDIECAVDVARGSPCPPPRRTLFVEGREERLASPGDVEQPLQARDAPPGGRPPLALRGLGLTPLFPISLGRRESAVEIRRATPSTARGTKPLPSPSGRLCS